MSCCGKNRNAYAGSLSSGNFTNSSSSKTWDDVSFEYTGDTGLTVKGSITGIIYRFSSKGDRRLVDYRDAGGMMAVPNLRKAKKW
jgi:hypothetical protein